ncbi:hypothetical protein ACG2LH_12585 [Zhouia sp. PK063]|uniref:hypothetical protein n=1 Tax=Zhouia sp. PK063 TaxID=3373602 RepID=UPI00378F184A
MDLLVFLIVGGIIFIANFKLFDDPIETELKVLCDYDGLRKVKMIEVSGNATLNPSIQIYAMECDYNDHKKPETIFIASAGYIQPKDVNFEWKNFDTIIIEYRKDLQIFKQKKQSTSLNPKITFKHIIK